MLFLNSTIEGPQTKFDHGFQCFTWHRRLQDEQFIRSYSLYIFLPCMRIRWVLETSPSDHYWRRYEVGQGLIFCWFWSWRTPNTQLVRQKLGKKNTPRPWQPPLPCSHHGAPPPGTAAYNNQPTCCATSLCC